jgi:hypothetical protein
MAGTSVDRTGFLCAFGSCSMRGVDAKRSWASARLGWPPPARLAPTPTPTASTPVAPTQSRSPEVRPATSVLQVSTREMPYLRDHCFFRQRADWPDEDDRWPVVPGTTIVQHMVDIAEKANPGLVVTVVEEVRLLEWLPATPPVEVTVEVSVAGPDLLEIRFGRYARARLRLAVRFPAAPARWPMSPERRPDVTAEYLYEGRMMFHGTQFRGVTDLSGMAEQHVRGTITTPSAPGALLDNFGQLFGAWIIVQHPERSHVLPVQIDSIQWFGRQPGPGTPVECLVRILSVSDSWVACEAQLTMDGRVLAQIGGWRDRRFDQDRRAQAAQCYPEYEAISSQDPAGWSLASRTWNDQSTQMFVMRTYLGAAERETYAGYPAEEQGDWLLLRIAVKDAVRRRLWDRAEAGAIFPAELQVEDAGPGEVRAAPTGQC